MAPSLLWERMTLDESPNRRTVGRYIAGCVHANHSGFVHTIRGRPGGIQRDRRSADPKSRCYRTHRKPLGTPAVSERVPFGVNTKP